ncbi:DUF58 domain-containing protein [Thiorhodococcus mannitoliphagus]|uniref:DUF58 domain-containing protein n=1 Tax=Thiorhodococcus mannitoliphagus TaxID=329406 RepID=A0A6P1DW11_9GAMM|nr:DUF58 domain-containing protein [Thiorhodococcus mannitoliphagus]NEX21353.1 DUF58 domain-containing protein [Thiorhodococcus mannitoliphagus]
MDTLLGWSSPQRAAPGAPQGVVGAIRGRVRRHFQKMLRRAPLGPDGVARIGARQIYILPTAAGMTYGAVMMVMLLGSLNYQNNLGLLFTFFLASVGIIAMHHAWLNLLGLAVQVRGGPAVFSGETATFAITVHAEGRRARYDIQTRKDRKTTAPLPIPAGDQASITLGIPTARRGLLQLDRLTLATRHPMGLFHAWCYVETDASTLVYPAPAAQAPDPGYDSGDARRPHKDRGDGMEDYLGSRGYRPGDSPRHVDWKAYARERGLLVKEFGGDEGQDVWIDWSTLRSGDTETRLSLLTRQVLDATEAGLRFGLRLPDGLEPLARGAAHAQRCLTRLALFQHG